MTQTNTETRSRTRGRIPVMNGTKAVQPVAPVQDTALAAQSHPDAVAQAEAQDALAAYWLLNAEANAATRKSEKAKKVLEEVLAKHNLKRAATNVGFPNGAVEPVVAEITAEPKEVVSVEKLRGLVDDETFMKIISATKTAVTNVAGTNVLRQATMTMAGTESMKVRKVTA